jgi:hypothetical protein
MGASLYLEGDQLSARFAIWIPNLVKMAPTAWMPARLNWSVEIAIPRYRAPVGHQRHQDEQAGAKTA